MARTRQPWEANAPKNLPKPSSGTTGTGILTSNCQAYKDGGPKDFDGANWNPWPKNWQQVFENNKGINSYGKPLHLNTQNGPGRVCRALAE